MKVCLFVTSDMCPFCIKARNNDGLLIPQLETKNIYGLYSFDYNFVKHVLTCGGKHKDELKWLFINLHYTQEGTNNVIISCFDLNNIGQKDEYITQFMFSPDPKDSEKSIRRIHAINSTKVLAQLSETHKSFNIPFSRIIEDLIPCPKMLTSFIPYKPVFLFYLDSERIQHGNDRKSFPKFYIRVPGRTTALKIPRELVPSKDPVDMEVLPFQQRCEEEEDFLYPKVKTEWVSNIRTFYDSRQR